jgi:hypothetical protein
MYGCAPHQYPPLTTVYGSRKHQAILWNLGRNQRFVKQRTQRHLDSSPTSIVRALKQLAKGALTVPTVPVARRLALAQARITELKAANKASARRKSHKRKRVQQERTLTVEERAQLAALQEFGARGDRKKGKKRERAVEGNQRKCGNCGKTGTGHNARTCKNNSNSL